MNKRYAVTLVYTKVIKQGVIDIQTGLYIVNGKTRTEAKNKAIRRFEKDLAKIETMNLFVFVIQEIR